MAVLNPFFTSANTFLLFLQQQWLLMSWVMLKISISKLQLKNVARFDSHFAKLNAKTL